MLFAVLIPIQLASVQVGASSAPAQFSIPDTTFTAKGFASPNAFVQIFDGDALIGTVIADANGIFEKTFPAMSSGLHNIKLQYQDNDGVLSDTVAQTINIRARADTATEYYLPPTLQITPKVSAEGDIISFSGYTIPNAIVEIILDGGNLILRPQSDANGKYSISVDSTGYYFGIHTVRATSLQGGLKSFQTQTKEFTINPIAADGQFPSRQDVALTPPVITTGGKVVTDQESNLIRGTAPPYSQIIIYLDGEPIGSTFANQDGAWFFNVQLLRKVSQIRAVACVNGECSDFSNLLTFEFRGEFGRCSSFRFWMNDYRFWGVRQAGGLDLSITGVSGIAPYEVLVDWGDDATERFNRDNEQGFNIHHVYDGYGQLNGSITMADDSGCEYTRYFSVDVAEAGFDKRWLASLTGLVPIGWFVRKRLTINRKRRRYAR